MEKSPSSPEGEIERLRQRNRILEKIVKEHSVEDAGGLAIAAAIADNIKSRPPLARKPLRSRRTDERIKGGILDIGDVHYGETVQARNTGGLFEYNTDIAEKRLDFTIDEAIEIGKDHKLAGLTVILGGDLVSGAIHDDLNRHNEMMVAEQTVSFAEIMYQGLEKLLSPFMKVDVVSVSGNHGRTMYKEKGYFKNKQQENYDWMVAKMLEAHGKKQKGLDFNTPDTVWAIIEVAGRRFLTTHGDTNKQQNSMGISFYAVEKEMRRLKTMIVDGTMPLHHDVISHHRHQQFAVPIGDTMFYNNGALKGPDEYGMMGLRPPEQAQQQMLIVEEGRVKAHYPIVSQHVS